jgi:hypothetical protein
MCLNLILNLYFDEIQRIQRLANIPGHYNPLQQLRIYVQPENPSKVGDLGFGQLWRFNSACIDLQSCEIRMLQQHFHS